jgi:hypothetical protein
MKNTPKILSKITLITLIVSVLSIPALKAQESGFGIKGGLNLSYLSIDDADDSNIVPGLHAGLFGEFFINEQFSVQPEILYSMKGVQASYDSDFLGFDVANGETELKLSYIDIPLYLKFNLAEDFNFHFGPYVGFLLNANYDTDNEVLNFIEIDDASDIDKDQFNGLDYGISGGLGFALEPVVMGFNYNLGLRPVAKDDEAMEAFLGDSKNNTIQVYVGLKF